MFRETDERTLMHTLECEDVPAIRLPSSSLLSRLRILHRTLRLPGGLGQGINETGGSPNRPGIHVAQKLTE